MFVVVGRIGRPHGIRGDVTIEVRTDDPAARFAPGNTLLTDPADRGPLTITAKRRSGAITLLHFDGIDSRDAAESLRETILRIDSDDDPDVPDDDEYYDHQLIGLRARHISGDTLGTVIDVLHPPAAPVLVVDVPDSADPVLVPFVTAIVPHVDVASGMLTIDPPAGMFGEIGTRHDDAKA